MHRNGDVLPNPSNIKTFVGGAANPVDLQIGPGGDLFYADFDGGTIRRISFTAQNQPYRGGDGDAHQRRCPSDVNFDGTRSSDPDPGDTLSYAWDLDGDGAYDDSTSPTPTYTYTVAGTYTASLEVKDNRGGLEHRLGDDQRRKHAANGHDHLARGGHDLEGRRRDPVRGRRNRRAGRPTAGVGALLEADPPSLLVDLPRA
jgi:hypothetical protein